MIWTAGLFFTPINIKIHVTRDLHETVAQARDWGAICMDNVYEVCIRGIQSNTRREVFEVRLCWIHACWETLL